MLGETLSTRWPVLQRELREGRGAGQGASPPAPAAHDPKFSEVFRPMLFAKTPTVASASLLVQ
jgi:hypothetical protein